MPTMCRTDTCSENAIEGREVRLKMHICARGRTASNTIHGTKFSDTETEQALVPRDCMLSLNSRCGDNTDALLLDSCIAVGGIGCIELVTERGARSHERRHRKHRLIFTNFRPNQWLDGLQRNPIISMNGFLSLCTCIYAPRIL